MTDLRDQLAAFEAAARRILQPAPARLVLVSARPAACHPGRPLCARSLCRPCYETARATGQLDRHPTRHTRRSQTDFVADYALLRSEGYTRRHIAERLHMSYAAVTAAYARAVRDGTLTPDRKATA